MHIIFLTHTLSYSGAPKMLTWVANQMAKKGNQVEVVSFFSSEKLQSLDENIVFHSLSVKQSSSRIIRNTVGMLRTTVRLHRYIKKSSPDLIVSFLDSVGYVYLVVNRLFGKRKMVVSERVDPSCYHGVTAKMRFFAMKFADGIVYQTSGAKEICSKKMKTDKGVIIPNPVVLKDDIKNQLDKYIVSYRERDNRIVTVGRLSLAQKRQDILLKAFKRVYNVHPEIKLYIYGDGSDKTKIQELIDSMGLHDVAILAGRTSQVEQDIYNARAFVLTSDFEGIPNALIEAMSIGVPSVSTNCSPGGAALLIKNGENAFLVDKADENAVAEKLIEIIEDETISDKFTANSPKISEVFSEDKISSEWENYFLRIING